MCAQGLYLGNERLLTAVRENCQCPPPAVQEDDVIGGGWAFSFKGIQGWNHVTCSPTNSNDKIVGMCVYSRGRELST